MPEFGLPGFVDGTDAAFAKFSDDFVIEYGFADHPVWRINEREFGK